MYGVRALASITSASSLLAALLLAAPAPASLGPVGAEQALLDVPLEAATGTPIDVKLRNPTASKFIYQMVNDESFWADASSDTFKNKDYDEIRLKNTSEGYMPMITGEGEQDFPHDVVTDVVFSKMARLPYYMSGAKRVARLGSGYDKTIGAPYVDTFWYLDLTLFYAVFPQRMYKVHDEATNQTFLSFEKIDSSFMSAEEWASYEAKMEAEKEKVDRRWALNSVIEVGEVYGIFIVGPGETRESRVTFVSKLAFGEDAGWVAKFGSQLPPVIKGGLKSGFKASVAIAAEELARRQGAEKPAE